MAIAPDLLARRAALTPTSTIRELLAVTEQPHVRSLAGGLPDPDSFPVSALAAAAARILVPGSALAATALQYGPTDGLVGLRELLVAPGPLHGLAAADPDDLVVTTGSQQGLDLLARVLLDPGDAVAVDDPCYLGARQTFVAAGGDLAGIPIDADGMCVDVLEARLRDGYRPRLVYTVANFQNPTGAVMAVERRIALAALAAKYGFVVVEDDPYRVLHFDAAPPPAIGVHDPDHVVTLGSLSKVLSPGLRIGWLRAPHLVREAIVRAKQASDLHTSTLTQTIAFDVLSTPGFLGAHIERIRKRYEVRASVLVAVLTAAEVEVLPVRGGMFAWAHLDGCNTDELLTRAVAAGVAFVPGSAFAVQRSWSDRVRLSFVTLPVEDLRIAAETLVGLLG